MEVLSLSSDVSVVSTISEKIKQIYFPKYQFKEGSFLGYYECLKGVFCMCYESFVGYGCLKDAFCMFVMSQRHDKP